MVGLELRDGVEAQGLEGGEGVRGGRSERGIQEGPGFFPFEGFLKLHAAAAADGGERLQGGELFRLVAKALADGGEAFSGPFVELVQEFIGLSALVLHGGDGGCEDFVLGLDGDEIGVPLGDGFLLPLPLGGDGFLGVARLLRPVDDEFVGWHDVVWVSCVFIMKAVFGNPFTGNVCMETYSSFKVGVIGSKVSVIGSKVCVVGSKVDVVGSKVSVVGPKVSVVGSKVSVVGSTFPERLQGMRTEFGQSKDLAAGNAYGLKDLRKYEALQRTVGG